MKSRTKRIISTLAICGALVLEAGAAAIGSLGKTLNNIAKVNAATSKTSTLTFTAACGGSGTANDGVSWKVESDASESVYDGTKGIHYGTGKIAVSYLKLSTSGISGTIKSIVVNACGGSKTAAQVGVTVNGSDFGTSQSLTASAASYTFSGSATGSIIVSITQASKTLALYCKSIAVTYEEAAANQLATPTNIAYSNGTLTWGAVEHATGYKVSVNGGTASTVTTNSKSIALNNTDSVSVIATDSTAAYTDSSAGTFKYINYGTESEPISVSDALKIAELHTNADVTDLAYVKGKLTENPTNTTYGNFHISDDGTSSNSLYVYGVTATSTAVSKSGNYWSFTNPKDFGTNSATKDLKSQDEAIFKLRLYNFSSTMEGDGLFVKMYVVKTNVDITGSDVAIKVGDDDVAPTTNVTGYTLTSNNTSIVSIVNNKIHAVAEGNTTVTISKTEDNEHTYTSKTINVTVSAATEPYIIPDKTAASGYTKTSEEVGVSYGNLLGTFSATSGNPSVATVDIKSNLSGRAILTVGYVAAGNATISLKDGANELATIAVSVSLSTVTISGMPATNSVYIGKTLDLGSLITVTPTGSCGSGVTWSTTDGGKATVDSNGVVTGVAAGTTTITATPDDFAAGAVSCTVTVSEAPLETTYDFVTNFSTYSNSWDSKTSYIDRDQLTHKDLGSEFAATVDLHYTSRQNSGAAIDNMPVFATKSAAGTFKNVLDFNLTDTKYTISHITVNFAQWGSKAPDIALYAGTGASGTALDSITISATTLSLDADVEDLTSFSVGYCDKSTSNVQAGLASINLQFKAKKTLTSIAVSNSHRSFDNGAKFVEETVTAHYSDSTSPTVSGATFKIKKDLEGSDFTDIPETLDMSYNNATVQVSYSDSYGSASTSYSINVHYAAATDVELNPTSTDVEKGKTFDLSNVAVTISPSTADQDDYEWSIIDKTEVSDSTLVGNTFTAGNNTGTVTLTCKSGSASANFVINVVDEPVPQITEFTVEGTPSKATQYRNATFALDLTGITLKAVYDIKDPETIGSDQFNWDTTGTNPIGTYKLDEDLTVTVDSITLADDFINSISFTASSDMSKKEYWVGDSWDFTGLAIEGKWASGLDLDVDTEKVSFSTTSTTSTAGEGLSIVVTAHYEGYTKTEPTLTVSGITIKAVEMESLSIDYTGGQPTLGEEFTFAGSITGNMSDGNTQPVDADDVTFSEIKKFITTEQTVTVTHKTTGATGTFKVQYKAFEPQKTYEYQLIDSALEDYSGQYLIVYEPGSIAMPGNNSTPGAAQAHVDISDYWVSDEHKAIKYNTSTSALSFTIEATEGGYYLYTTVDDSTVYIRSETSSKNGMQYASNPTANFINTFSYENDTGETQLHGVFSTNILHYNDNAGSSGEMFRFYKDGGQKAVQYYKLVETGSEEADLIKLNVSCSKTFKEGETLNISDLTITGLYNDGYTKSVTGVTFNDGTSKMTLAGGDNTVTVKLGDITETITVYATPKVPVSSVVIGDKPTGDKLYYYGEFADEHQFSATVLPDDATDKSVTWSITSGDTYASIDQTGKVTVTGAGEGPVTIQAKAGDQTDSYTFSVVLDTVSSIAIKTAPSKVNYIEDESVNLSGLVITATMNSGATHDFAYNGDGEITCDKSVVAFGDTSLTIYFDGQSTTQTISVAKKSPDSISSSATQTEYDWGSTVDKTKFSGNVTFNNGEVKSLAELNPENIEINGFDSSVAGKCTVKVSYTENGVTVLSDPIELTIRNPKLTGISGNTETVHVPYVTTLEQLKNYLTINALYEDGSSVPVTDYSFSGFVPQSKGTQTVTIAYEEKTCDITIYVDDGLLTSISVDKESVEVGYGSSYKDQVVVTAHYEDGVTKEIPGTDYTDNFDPTNIGVNSVTITYQEKTCNLSVTVLEAAVESIHVDGYDGTSPIEVAYEGSLQDVITVIAHYEDGNENPVIGYTVSNFDNKVKTEQSVTISFGGKETNIRVQVLDSTVVSELIVTAYVPNVDYGYDYDTCDVLVKAVYTDGEVDEAFVHLDLELVGYQRYRTDVETENKQSLYVQLGDVKSESFEITVNLSTEATGINAQMAEGKQQVEFGYELALTDVVVTATYKDGHSAVISCESIDNYNKNAVGVQTISVGAVSKEASAQVEVLASTVVDYIEVDPTEKTLAYGELLGAYTVKAVYTDDAYVTGGHKVDVTADATIDSLPTAPGSYDLKVRYGGKEATLSVTVNQSTVIDHIEVDPSEMTLEYGQRMGSYVVNAVYTDDAEVAGGHKVNVTSLVEVSEFNGTPGDHILTITYSGKSCQINYHVNASTVIDHIEASTNKETVTFGEDFVKEDVSVTYVYTDGHKVSGQAAESISGFDKTVLGEQTVHVYAVSKETTIKVTVVSSAVIDHIEVDPSSKTLEYGEEIGSFVVYAVYTDSADVEGGHKVDVTSACVIGEFDGTPGNHALSIKYNDGSKDHTCSLNYVVKESTIVDHIEATANKNNLEFNSEFTKDDVTVTYVYTDGHKVGGQAAESISGYKANHSGEQDVTVMAIGKSTTIKVTVKELPEDTDVKVKTETVEVEYNAQVDSNDIKLNITFPDGHVEEVGADSLEGFNPTKVGEQEVVAKVGGKSVTFRIIVKASEVVDHIEVEVLKPEVQLGYNFTKDDVKVTFFYTDGHTSFGPADVIEGFNKEALGAQEVTVIAKGHQAKITVTVTNHYVTSLEVTGYTENVDQGKEYVFDGKVIAHYADETSAEVTDYTITKVNTEGHGPQKATVSYGGLSVEITINVIQTKTPLEPTAIVGIVGGSVVGVSALAVGLYFLLKSFKLKM